MPLLYIMVPSILQRSMTAIWKLAAWGVTETRPKAADTRVASHLWIAFDNWKVDIITPFRFSEAKTS